VITTVEEHLKTPRWLTVAEAQLLMCLMLHNCILKMIKMLNLKKLQGLLVQMETIETL
jgi:hypothetical protein